MWETDTRDQTRQQATYNKLEEAVLKLEEANARIAGYERLMHELRTLPNDEAVRLFWRIRGGSSGGSGGGSGGGNDSEGYDWLVGGAGGMSIGEDEFGVATHTHQQQLAGELPPPPPPPPPSQQQQFAASAMGLGVGIGVGEHHHTAAAHHHHHHHQQQQQSQQQQQQQQQHQHQHHHQAYGESSYQEGHLYGERHRHHR